MLYKLLSGDSQSELKSIMITSAMIAEGKSTVCSFLAVTAALKKQLKTLIIDCDLRLPAIHKLFGLPSGPGLVEILRDGVSPKETVQRTGIENLDILPSGRHSESPTEIFDADAIGTVIDEMKFYYDLILLDCAPLLPVSDPMLLASKVDGSLLVVKVGATQKELVERAVGILNPEKTNVLGVVLNNMNHSLPYYYNYDYYSYDYRQPALDKEKPVKEQIRNKDSKKKSDEDQALKGNIGQS